eukprot:gb/GECG01015155.1/.p1 GENE.gb/GECG01015155.1/~~gb/GECG01015155.1/.p1  ORF type:complete len:584 (+),score=51.41 gb/GECG01015155.1/:1-1752(+)
MRCYGGQIIHRIGCIATLISALACTIAHAVSAADHIPCLTSDSEAVCVHKGQNLAEKLWDEHIGVTNDRVQPLKDGLLRATKHLFAARSPRVWSGIRENRDQKWCPEDSYFEFFPGTAASVSPGNSATWEGSCFSQMQAKLTSMGGDNYTLTLGGSNTNSTGCSDTYLIVTSYDILGLLDISTLDNSQSLPFSVAGSNQHIDLMQNGVHILFMPCGILGSIESLVKTVGLFVGNGQPLLERNAKFLKYKGIYKELKKYNEFVELDKSLIKSGDYLAISRFDGLSPMIMYGTGGQTGHAALAVWDDDELYVCESTAADPFGTVFWPPPYGIIRTKWDTWVKLARNASYHVNFLPLAEEYSQKFDTDAYWKWFRTVEGMPYGFHNMLYSFMDTSDPERNFPSPIGNWEIQTLLNVWSTLYAPEDHTSVYSLFIQALNHRTGQSCKDMTCVTDWLVNHNKTIGEVTAIPEQDEWMYGQNYSLVCSVFTAHGWKVGLKGVIPDYEATEQTPKDNCQMKLFSTSRIDASVCPNGLHTSANGNYCQIMGEYWMDLEGFNSIPLYEQMNNHCPSKWPDYFRCPDSNPQCC